MPRVSKQQGERSGSVIRRPQKDQSTCRAAREKALYEFTDDQDEDFKLPQGKRARTTGAWRRRDKKSSKQDDNKQALPFEGISRQKPDYLADNTGGAQSLDALGCDDEAISCSTEIGKLPWLKKTEFHENEEKYNSGYVGEQCPDFPTSAELTSQSKYTNYLESAERRKFINCAQTLNNLSNHLSGKNSDRETTDRSKAHESTAHYTDNDAAIAEELQRAENSKDNQEHIHAVDLDVCEFCFKDIKHFNSTRKRQHINRCCDSITASLNSSKGAKAPMEAEKCSLLLTCPICGKLNKTERGKKVHLKQCSKKHNVSTVELINLLKSMESGSLPPVLKLPEDPSTKEEAFCTANSKAKRHNKKRSEKALDEKTQIALALSASESSLQSDENRRTKLARKANIVTELPDIIMISEEDKQQRMEERATMLVKDDCSEEISCTPVLNPSKVASKYALDTDFASNKIVNGPVPIEEVGGEIQTAVNTTPKQRSPEQSTEKGESLSSILPCKQPLWDLASSAEDLVNQRPFYVTELLPALGLSEGRTHAMEKVDESADIQRATSREAQAQHPSNLPCLKPDHHDDPDHLPDTQLVNILTDLGGEHKEDLDGNQGADAKPHLDDKESEVPCPADGFMRNVLAKGVQEKLFSLQAEAHKELSVNFHATLFSSDFSDLVVHCRHGVEVPAHKVILASRSAYLKEALSGEVTRLDLSEFSDLAVKAVLRHIYCGELALDSAVVTDVQEMTKRFGLIILEKACQIYVEQDPILNNLADKVASDTTGELDNAAFLLNDETEEDNQEDTQSEDREAGSGDEDWIQASVAVLLRTSFVDEEHSSSSVAGYMEKDDLDQGRGGDRLNFEILDTEEDEAGQQPVAEPNTCSPPLFEEDMDTVDYQNPNVLTSVECDERRSKSCFNVEGAEFAPNVSCNDPILAMCSQDKNIVIINSDSDLEDEGLFETQKYCSDDSSSPTVRTSTSVRSTCNSPALVTTESCDLQSRMQNEIVFPSEAMNSISKSAVIEEDSKVLIEPQLLSLPLEGGLSNNDQASFPASSCSKSKYCEHSSGHESDFESLNGSTLFARTSSLADRNGNSSKDEVFRISDSGSPGLVRLCVDTDASGDDDAEDDAALSVVFHDGLEEDKIRVREILINEEENIDEFSRTDVLTSVPCSQDGVEIKDYQKSGSVAMPDNLDSSVTIASQGVSSFGNVSHCDFEDDGGYNCDIMEFDIPSSPSPLSSPSSEVALVDCAIGTRAVSRGSSDDHVEANEELANGDKTLQSTSKLDLDDSLVQHLDAIDDGDAFNLSITVENAPSSQREVCVTPEKIDRPSPELNNKQRKFGPGDCKHPETGETITPFPDYAQMDSPELIAKAKRFALRQTLPKKVLVAKLEEIYKYQHDFTVWEATPIQKRCKRKGVKRKPDQEDRRCQKVARVDRGGNTSDGVFAEEKKTSEDRQKETAVLELDLCHRFQNGSSSSDESEQDEFERSVLSHDDDTETLTTGQTCKENTIPLKKQLTDLIRADKSLYIDILTYKPLNFDALRKILREKGVSCSKEQLLDYLDQQCICFTAPRAVRKVGNVRKHRRKTKQSSAPD